MTEALFWSGIFALSLFVLIKASNYFTGSAEKIGLMAGISQFVIGVTIVSVGTSLPELVASIIAVLSDSSEIVTGNVVGSNVANIFLILAAGAVMAKRLQISHDLLPVDLPMLIGSAFFLGLAVWDHVFTFGEAFLFVLGFIVFVIYSISNGQSEKRKKTAIEGKIPFEVKPVIVLVVSAVFVYLGAKYTIESIIKISEILNIGTEIIAVTAVAVGTSLPELAVTYSAVQKKNGEIIIGNVLGSNVFNTFAVMGIPGLISDLIVPTSMTELGIPVMIIATTLFLVVTVDRKVTQWEGWLFFVFYAFFVGKAFNLL